MITELVDLTPDKPYGGGPVVRGGIVVGFWDRGDPDERMADYAREQMEVDRLDHEREVEWSLDLKDELGWGWLQDFIWDLIQFEIDEDPPPDWMITNYEGAN